MVEMAKIYISSTYEDLKKEREAAAKAVLGLLFRSLPGRRSNVGKIAGNRVKYTLLLYMLR
ncbi:MAG: DUF4062 domain-containing protein, partial [Candidatus Aminicenantes bacterium]|nr:DUF4062 domain-containing protein [Candidatus Aminicenantes bacterium]NIM85106.1 DUF4062 domain-containing protein [Candidatus Aminicenantes bacterium]NIN24613.1 DUF4062 domain-containing protein [Candidatus Aminicenantes bacterium]NIN48377.1 DUF4062 domain-containing protein [Candidatus Aminicenantes bacterium]NIN91280.1 DUF4062 domain-containing protein [Candidatus Aminicenantes bacterium]